MPVDSRSRYSFTPLACGVALVLFAFFIPARGGELPLDTGADNHAGLAFSPDGSKAFFSAWDGKWGSKRALKRTIYVFHKQPTGWSKPQTAPFSGEYSDDDPFVSPDGRWLYFVSERPILGAELRPDGDIWRYSLDGDGQLEHLAVNSSAAEYSPVVTVSGTLYFASARDGGVGQGDLYRAGADGLGFAPPEPLGMALNSDTGEWNLWVSADESEILFEASSRVTNVSVPGDLYYSWKTDAGWTAAQPVTSLNSIGSDLLPRMHPDGSTLFYTTANLGGQARIVSAPWPPLREQLRKSYAPALLVANRSSHEVTFVDLALGKVVARVATGEGPHLLSNVAGGRVLATGYGDFPRPHVEPVAKRPPSVRKLNSRLTLIDTNSHEASMDIVIEGCTSPHSSWIIGAYAYVTCEPEERVAIVDLASGGVLRHIDTLQKGAHVLSFDAASQTLVVSNTDSGSVSLIDVGSGDTRVVSLASGSEGAAAIDGRIWVGNAFDKSVSIVDPVGGAVTQQIGSVCSFPIAIGHGSGPLAWVACFASAELVAIDRNTFAIERRIRLPDQPLNVLVHPQWPLAYVSYPRQNAVGEIDLNSGQEIRRIRVGIEPDGLRWATLP